MNTTKFWFDDFTPDVLIDPAVNDVSEYISEVRFRSIFDSKIFSERDPIISDILHANVHYIGTGKKKVLINAINKKYKLNMYPYILSLQVYSDGECFIFIDSFHECSDCFMDHRYHVQTNYNFRNYYLRDNKYRTARTFINHFCKPMYPEMIK